jgi:hypothetical protein
MDDFPPIMREHQFPRNLGRCHLQLRLMDGRGGFRTCDLSRVKHGRGPIDLADLQGKSRAWRAAFDRKHPVSTGFCREFGTTLSQTPRELGAVPRGRFVRRLGHGLDGVSRTPGVLMAAHATST